jgi:transcriptional regulator with XRE-family HTH domain
MHFNTADTVYKAEPMLKTIPDEMSLWAKANAPDNFESPFWGWSVFPSGNRPASLSRPSAPAERKSDVTSLSPSEQIVFIRETLSLNMSQIAELTGVTRPTAYAWLDGRESDRGDTAGKIMRLAVEVEMIKGMNIPRVDLLVKRSIFNGKSVLDLLRECKDITSEIDELKAIGDKEEATRRNNRIPKNKIDFSRMNEAIDEISTPIYFEESID